MPAQSRAVCRMGGNNENGTTVGLDTETIRMGSERVHQIDGSERVSAFFHGHDHSMPMKNGMASSIRQSSWLYRIRVQHVYRATGIHPGVKATQPLESDGWPPRKRLWYYIRTVKRRCLLLTIEPTEEIERVPYPGWGKFPAGQQMMSTASVLPHTGTGTNR